MTFVLIAAVCMLIHSAIAWALSEAHRNYQGSHRGKVGVIVSVLAAAVAGAGFGWLNFLIGVGRYSVEQSELAGAVRHIVVR